ASDLRQSYGLAPLRTSVTDFAATMPLYLVPSSQEFDYERNDLPRSVHYVGPCLMGHSESRHLSPPIAGLNPELPWVYVSEGTLHLDPLVLRCAAQGLANLSLEVIITTGRHRVPETLDLGPRPLASNIHVRQWLELNPLLPHLRALVNVG